VFVCDGNVEGVGKLEWYDEVIGASRRFDLCYKCAKKLAEIVEGNRNE